MEKVTFTIDSDEPVEFYVLEETKLNGFQYILVTESEEGDSDALILKDVAASTEQESVYEVVSDDTELQAISQVFASLLDDVEFTQD
ncbi:MAG: DUF1292 domain-containing protein [Eubacteriales bacterium]